MSLPEAGLHQVGPHHPAEARGQVLLVLILAGHGPQTLIPLIGPTLHLYASIPHLLHGKTHKPMSTGIATIAKYCGKY